MGSVSGAAPALPRGASAHPNADDAAHTAVAAMRLRLDIFMWRLRFAIHFVLQSALQKSIGWMVEACDA
jgi:hypothetical protein